MSRLLPRLAARTRTRTPASPRPFQCLLLLHTSAPACATTLPITAHGPPPKPPLPAGEIADLRRRQKLERAQNTILSAKGGRFWKEVTVVETNGALGINLDTRPLKTPTKQPLLIPRTKPLLAAAIALEWSLLRTSADALKSYLTPLTGLASRALDLEASEAPGGAAASGGVAKREDIIENLLRYLDTDTLLCFAPTAAAEEEGRRSLREMQEEAARPIAAFMATNVWPGVELVPVDGDEGLVAVKGQPRETRAVVRGWMEALGAWDLVGLERAVLATKSLVIAARLVAEWSEEMQVSMGRQKIFGADEAAEAASVEVRFQTGRWGEVEDTHDVEKEDLKRQLGAARVLVAGIKNFSGPGM